MAEIVRLDKYREQNALQAGFRLWRECFLEDFHDRTRLGDLSPETLCKLGEPGDHSAAVFYALILGFLECSKSTIDSLESRLKLKVVDIHLFLGDQIRFEMMRRLGWVIRFHGARYPLFEMVREFERIKKRCQQQPPLLATGHPRYKEYAKLIERDQQVFIRQMFPSALEAFQSAFTP